MDPCTLHEDWEEIGPTSDRLDGLQDLADLIIEAWGIEGVTVKFGELEPDTTAGEYDPNTKEITLDLDHLSDPTRAFDTLFHEMMHAVDDQWDVPEDLQGGLHPFFDEAADQLVSELLASCVSTDLVESGASATIPAHPWVIEVGEDQ